MLFEDRIPGLIDREMIRVNRETLSVPDAFRLIETNLHRGSLACRGVGGCAYRQQDWYVLRDAAGAAARDGRQEDVAS